MVCSPSFNECQKKSTVNERQTVQNWGRVDSSQQSQRQEPLRVVRVVRAVDKSEDGPRALG
jgi:hypothetical protein